MRFLNAIFAPKNRCLFFWRDAFHRRKSVIKDRFHDTVHKLSFKYSLRFCVVVRDVCSTVLFCLWCKMYVEQADKTIQTSFSIFHHPTPQLFRFSHLGSLTFIDLKLFFRFRSFDNVWFNFLHSHISPSLSFCHFILSHILWVGTDAPLFEWEVEHFLNHFERQ